MNEGEREPTPWTYATVELGTYGDHGEKQEEYDGPGNAFIQWKGTDVCFDFFCECGSVGHFDGFFAYQFRCGNCQQVWAMPFTVFPVKVEPGLLQTADPVDLDMDSVDENGRP